MNWLGYTEEDVWKLTPRKWNALVTIHLELLTKKYGGDGASKAITKGASFASSQAPTGYIDDLDW